MRVQSVANHPFKACHEADWLSRESATSCMTFQTAYHHVIFFVLLKLGDRILVIYLSRGFR